MRPANQSAETLTTPDTRLPPNHPVLLSIRTGMQDDVGLQSYLLVTQHVQ